MYDLCPCCQDGELIPCAYNEWDGEPIAWYCSTCSSNMVLQGGMIVSIIW